MTRLFSRRQFWARSFSATALLPVAAEMFAKSDIAIALQLFSVRDVCEKDLGGVLSQLAKFGYQGVEFAGFYGRSAAEVRRMLDDVSLRCCGSHTPLDQLTPEKIQQTIEFNSTIGNRNLIVPGLPAEYHSAAGWKSAADLFNSLASTLAKAGMRIGYHNHSLEFERLSNGQLPFDIFFGNTRPEVTMQLDLGNARLAGADPNTLLRKYPGRCKSIHVKDCVPGKADVLLGTSDFDWAPVLRTCLTVAGTEWYIIEHESHDLPAMEAAEENLQRFQKIVAASA